MGDPFAFRLCRSDYRSGLGGNEKETVLQPRRPDVSKGKALAGDSSHWPKVDDVVGQQIFRRELGLVHTAKPRPYIDPLQGNLLPSCGFTYHIDGEAARRTVWR